MNCWFWEHKWGKWEQYKAEFSFHILRGPEAGKEIPIIESWQKRKCLNCDKEEREKI